HQYAVAVGGAQGLLESPMAVALPVSYIANKRWPYYRNLPRPTLKSFGVVMVAVPAFIIAGETAGRRFEKATWRRHFRMDTMCRERANRDQVALVKRREEARWKDMRASQKLVDFTERHQFSAIAGCWALRLGLTDRSHRDWADIKIVQARMWSQGVTIGVVIAAAAVTRTRMYRRDGMG
ncbi:hypothetical protein F5148DRAFT_972127, partial [Russula earlei]